MPFPRRLCTLCPRLCAVERSARKGRCALDEGLRLASASLHFGEEPPITGRGGSGTIFFSGCSLRCLHCQNYQISRENMGVKVSEEEFIEIMLEAQRRGAENINLVTAAPQIPPVVRAVKSAKARGLSIPVLWNTSSYETLPSLLLINEVVDGYLPDLKTLDADIAKAFFDAEDYPRYAERAILFMLEHKPERLIIRHLILPGFLSSTRKVLEWFALHAAGKARLSLMTQYTPPSPSLPPAQRGGQCALQMPEPPCRRVNIEEYETALSWLEELGIEEGFYQELEDDASWLPDFTRENPFSSSLSRPLWHWRRGMIYTGLC